MFEFAGEDTCRRAGSLAPIREQTCECRTFRVHVTNFLDLERTLKTSGILESTSHDKQRARDLESLRGELLEALILVEHSGDLLREGMKTGDNLVAAFGERDTIFRELECHHNECDILRRIGLYPRAR